MRPCLAGPVDSVYLDAPQNLRLDVGTGAAVSVDVTGWQDAVLWNPWTAMQSCYEKFVCVEQVHAACCACCASKS